MIRLATKEDLPELLRMCLNFHQNSPYRNTQISIEKVVQTISLFTEGNLPKRVLLVLVDSLGHPKGLLAGQMTKTLFGEELQAIEVMWWVDEDYRGKESLRLCEAYEDWALRFGADLIHMSLLNTEHKASLEKFYIKRGYQECEASFVKYVRK